jgi:YebC/PmpR family DNA-binding regulatory protein
MSGHSKWSSIKRKKAVTDQKRASHWMKIIREITVAARAGGGDPAANPRLRLAVDNAKAANMPNDNVERAIRKGTGDLEGVEYQEVTYEAYGPAGVAIFIEGLTDNVNRTVADVRHALSKHGGNLGQTGSVAWMFDHKGQIVIDGERYDEGTVLEAALEAGAEDMQADDDGSLLVTTGSGELSEVEAALRSRGLELESAALGMVPRSTVRVEGPDAARLLKLLDILDDLDDVQRVHTNADIDEESLVEA